MKNIRNFCIIAHIDHGKSTLADRLLEYTKTIEGKDLQAQVLDDMDLERERGITIKSHAIQMNYTLDGEEYILNLIDTPGHVDFSYEVSRSIAACEGALLIVDAAQGIQAQTISNLYMAIENDLEIIPVINKIDLPSAMPEEVEDQIVELLGCKRKDILRSSGKTGEGVYEILEVIIKKVPPPKGDPDAPLQCLIFDSVFNSFRGIIAYFKVENGVIRKGDRVKFIATGKEYDADEIGVLKLTMSPRQELRTGDVGYIISGIKTSKEVRVGDTITHVARPAKEGIAGFEEVKPMVFAGVYPIEAEDFENLRSSLEKLQLNDASLTFQPESSAALGFGFRCGFLGLLHMEIVQERLDREFDMDVITTVPNVSYKVYDKKGNCLEVHNPSGLPDPTLIDRIEEPYIRASVITRTAYIGPIMTLCLGKRGSLIKQEYISGDRVEIYYDLPLGEIVIDFYDKLKSISKGYASFDYHLHDYRPSKLVKLDILLNGESVDALSTLTHIDNSVNFGRRMCEKLKELIPRQQFDIAIQAAIGAKIIARETIKAVRKDVTAKCYGGDISRKRKLLEKQKEGKKRMKQIGSVEVPQKAFLAVLKLD
ncbi:translation elongation factor 4 [Parabacteroides sp. Marseille-P3160]|uniref:translation elongation factor 4 n=1 Tax=Parabacteroides sp. Marseille-P3160 TaxID=1917887 RepID=UPI0009BC4513|nr:translation elongation factor 4 [Parabacteroides sp. Marseille-P3160]